MMISNLKNPLVFKVYTKMCQRCNVSQRTRDVYPMLVGCWMLEQRRARRLTNTTPALGQRIVFADLPVKCSMWAYT